MRETGSPDSGRFWAAIEELGRRVRSLEAAETDVASIELAQERDCLLRAVLGGNTGGQLMYGWLGNSRQAFGQAAATGIFTETNVGADDYMATSEWAPYVDLDGASEYLTIADAAWQEVGSNPLFVWHWVYTDTTGTTYRTITGKLLGPSDISWGLQVRDTPVAWMFLVNNGGTTATNVMVESSHAVGAGAWHFVAGYYRGVSGLLRIYVGEASETALTIDSLTTGVPASVYNGSADLRIGANSDPGQYWDGGISAGAAWLRLPEATIDDYATWLFESTKAIYQ